MKSEEIPVRVREVLGRLKRPASEKDLLKHLRVKGQARTEAKQVLETMVSQGELARTRTGRFGLPEKMDLVAGRLETKAGGFGFVLPDRKVGSDIYIPGAGLGEALDGDRVLVHVEKRGHSGKREGRVVDVLDVALTRWNDRCLK